MRFLTNNNFDIQKLVSYLWLKYRHWFFKSQNKSAIIFIFSAKRCSKQNSGNCKM